MLPARWVDSTVCHRCAKIKQVCDGNTPCSRCTRLSLPCQKRSASGSIVDSGSSLDLHSNNCTPDQAKARIRRVQTGCLMCKKRKKKCDEQEPACGDCKRLQLDCSWSSERKRKKGSQQETESTSLPETVPWPTDGIEKTRSLLEIGSVSPSNSLPNSAMNDRHTHIDDMNQEAPIDASMFDLDLSTEGISWDFTRDLRTSTTTASEIDSALGSIIFSTASSHSRSLSIYVPSLMPDLTSPDDRALFNHYSAVVANTLCRTSKSQHTNPYINHILPMAVSNDMILHCVLALSASHWKQMQPRFCDRGLFHQGKATHELAGMLFTVAKDSANVALSASLLLCMTEILDGQSSGWKHHLQGAKRLLTNMLTADQDDYGADSDFLIGLARFLDSATTTSTCAPPLIQEGDHDPRLLTNMSSRLGACDMAVYGIPKALFHLVDRVNSLAQKRKTRVDVESETDFRQQTAKVEDLLDHWSFEYGGLSQAVASLSSTTQPKHDVFQATTAYEWALRLRLHQIKDGYTLNDPFVPKAVDKILMAVQDMRYGSPLEGCLLFPLVMAGSACEVLGQRFIIQDRLMVMERTYGFGYIYRARELVEKVWEHRDVLGGTGSIVNWARIRFEEMGGLVIF